MENYLASRRAAFAPSTPSMFRAQSQGVSVVALSAGIRLRAFLFVLFFLSTISPLAYFYHALFYSVNALSRIGSSKEGI